MRDEGYGMKSIFHPGCGELRHSHAFILHPLIRWCSRRACGSFNGHGKADADKYFLVRRIQ